MPDSGADPDGAAICSLASESDSSNSEQIALSDVSPRDKPWDKHRAFADRVEDFYAGSEFHRYSQRVHDCAEILRFGLLLGDDDALKLKLRSAKFCRLRHCPVCQWRRSLMWKAKAFKVLPKIIESYPKHRWLFLTLTQRNVPIADLKVTLTVMNRAFQRLSQLRAFPAIGWLRSTEVTRGKDGSAHPHFHCLLMVPPGYFAGKNYLKQAEWVELWRKSMRLDYDPILDVQAVKQGRQPMDLVPELLKYCTKEGDLVADREWFLELTRQMHKMRAIATGGVLKEYLKELEQEPEDLIGKDDEAESINEASICFGWGRQGKRYKMMNT